MRLYKWRRPRGRAHPDKPKVGIRALSPNEIWHVDITLIRLLNGSRVYLQAVIDNCSRRILAWRVSDFSIALDEFANAAELLDDHAHTWYYLAEARHASQDEPGAREAYARCLAINPNHGRAIRRLAALASPPEEEP